MQKLSAISQPAQIWDPDITEGAELSVPTSPTLTLNFLFGDGQNILGFANLQ